MVLALMLVIDCANLNAQNRITIDNGSSYTVIQAPTNYTVKQINNNVVTTKPIIKPYNAVSTEKDNHLLEIHPDDGWQRMDIYNGSDFYDVFYAWDGAYYSRLIPEGRYDILIEDEGSHILNYENVNIINDTVMTPSFSEASHRIIINATDENGIPISNLQALNGTTGWSIYFNWNQLGDHGYGQYYFPISDTVPNFYFNSFSEKSILTALFQFSTEGQKAYYYVVPEIYEAHGNIDILINKDDLLIQKEYFNSSNFDVVQYAQGFANNGMFYVSMSGAECIYNQEQPLLTITNQKIDELEYDHLNFQIQSIVGNDNFLNNCIRVNPKAPNSNGIWRWEPLCTENFFFYRDNECENPITPCVYQVPSNIPVYYGYRTPILYYNSYSLTEEENLYGGETVIQGGFFALGENGCARLCDLDEYVRVTVDDNEIYNDAMLNFAYLPSSKGLVKMEITDNHVFYYDKNLTNNTRIEFDLRNDDHQPPILTLLQVLNADNEENTIYEDLNNAKIRFAAGDFDFDQEQWTFPYLSTPNINVFYSTDGTSFLSIDFVEVSGLFNKTYGNVFEIDLSQLAGNVNDQWVSMKFVITDEAGNSQTQELSNLFYVGEMTSVAETTTLAHAVYPNPFTNEVRINAAEAVNGNASISVFNVLGEQVISKAMNCSETNEFVIDGSSLNAGIYFYSIATENGTLQGRIVKE